jgi:hypothetical protein
MDIMKKALSPSYESIDEGLAKSIRISIREKNSVEEDSPRNRSQDSDKIIEQD